MVVVGILIMVVGSAVPTFAASAGPIRIESARNPRGKFLGVVASRGTGYGAAARAAVVAPLTYHGGPVQHASRVYAIFWAPSGYAFPAGYTNLVSRYFTDVAHDSFRTSNTYATDTQYFDITHRVKQFVSYSVQYGATILDTDPLPPDGCTNYLLADDTLSQDCLTDAQIAGEVQAVVHAHQLGNGLGSEYFLFTPKGLASCFDASALTQGGCYDPQAFHGYCAYHSSTIPNASAVLYANMAYADQTGCSSGVSPNGNAADAVLNVVSHENNETMTDPLGNAWFDSTGNENGDKCGFAFGRPIGSNAFGLFNQVINGHDYWLQQEWSNRTAGCAQRNTFPQPKASFTHTPVAPVRATPVTFEPTAHDSDDTAFTYRWTFPNGSVSTRADPTFTFAFAGPKKVTLIVYDAHGDQTAVTRTITVT